MCRDEAIALVNAGRHVDAFNRLRNLIETSPSAENFAFVAKQIRNLDLTELKLAQIKIAILSSFIVDPAKPYLEVKCYQKGLKPEIYFGGFNQFQQEILSEKSRLYEFNPDVLILAVRPQEIIPDLWDRFLELSGDQIESRIEETIKTIKLLLNTFRNRSGAAVVMQNLELPASPDLGILDHRAPIGQVESIEKINHSLHALSREINGLYILDYNNLMSSYGKLNWQDEKMWFLAKMPIAGKYLPILADEYMRYIGLLKGLSNRKCLVLDLDNTLWGGVLGEEGLDRIKIGNTFPGNIFLSIQKEILKLYNKGVILAVNSRNNESDVLQVLDRHPNMLLRRKHFALIVANWNSKPENMKKIAKYLNIGIDSLVFVDDDIFERELMKNQLPEVLTLEMPENAELFPKTLRELRIFENLSLSEEDRKRGELYQAQIARKELWESSCSTEDFYRSLVMEAIIRKADGFSIPRIAQLTQKTNQFNLTTKRYSDNDIIRFSKSPTSEVFYLRLSDRYGDNGIVGVAIIDKESESWAIDTLLLSCRVLGRTVETAFLSFLISKAKEEGKKLIIGSYIPTEKNEPCREFYKKHKFEPALQDNEKRKWILRITQSEVTCPPWIKLNE